MNTPPNESTEAALSRALALREIHFSKKEYANVVAFQQSQQRYWRTIIEALPQADHSSQMVQNRLLNNYTNTNFYETQHVDEEIIIKSSLPLLTQEAVEQFIGAARHDPPTAWAALAAECKSAMGDIQVQGLSLQFFIRLVQYFNGGAAPKDLSTKLHEIQQAANDIHARSNKAAAEIEDAVERHSQTVTQFVEQQKSDLSAYKVSLSEDIKTKSSTSLWSRRAGWYRLGSMVWFVVFVVLSSAIIYYFVDHVSDIAKNLPRDSNGNIPYVGILLVVIPVLGAAWLLRLISRFLNNNQVLADDARHRQAMTQTYLALVADQNSGVTERDRLIMLSAIFRPLPGAQVDEVAPPTVLDLLKRPD